MHLTSKSVWIIIPAYNEGRTIEAVVIAVRDCFPNIVVVDDSSTDDTAELALRAGASVVSHPINLGQGAALQTGFDFALRKGAAHIVTFDADGQHDAADIPKLIEALELGKADFVLGSRFLGRTINMSLSRRLLLKAALSFTRFTTGLKITDVHNGLRAMTAAGARVLRIRQNRMAHASELLEQISQSNLGYVEVPVTVVYTDYSLAKGQRLTNSLSILIDLLVGRLQQ